MISAKVILLLIVGFVLVCAWRKAEKGGKGSQFAMWVIIVAMVLFMYLFAEYYGGIHQ